MGELLKDQFFNKHSLGVMAEEIKKIFHDFDKESFLQMIFDAQWKKKELKERMRHVTLCLAAFLPKDYKEAILILQKVAPSIKHFSGMCFPDFVEVFGMDEKYEKISIEALLQFTQYTSSEFAIRPFILRDQTQILKLMLLWTKHSNEHVRRLSSEGCRPRLPWGLQLKELIKNPSPVFPIIVNLLQDPSEYVRRSVANNLNDIAKDHPQLVIDFASKHIDQNPRTNEILKHGLRTLLKKSDKRALSLFGVTQKNVILGKVVCTKNVLMNSYIYFTYQFELKKNEKIRLEYAFYFLRQNGKYSKKVFKISEKELEKGQYQFKKAHLFKPITTRKYYEGRQFLSVIINGIETEKIAFHLKLQ